MRPKSEYNVHYVVKCRKGEKEWVEQGSLQRLKCNDSLHAKSEGRNLIERWASIVGASITFESLTVKALQNTVIFE